MIVVATIIVVGWFIFKDKFFILNIIELRKLLLRIYKIKFQ